MVPPTRTPGRKPLHERSGSDTNTAGVRLVPATPPQLLCRDDITEDRDNIYNRTAIPTHPSHFLPPPNAGDSFLEESSTTLTQSEGSVSSQQNVTKQFGGQGLASTISFQPRQTVRSNSVRTNSLTSSTTGPSSSKSSQRKRKQVKVNPDKTFSVLEVDQDESDNGGFASPSSSVSPSTHDLLSPSTDDFAGRATSGASWQSETTATTLTTAPSPIPDLSSKLPAIEDDTPSPSPRNYELVGGLRKVPKSPDWKQTPVPSSHTQEPPLPDLPEDYKATYKLSSKQSFQSGVTTSTNSDYNYKVFRSSPPLLVTASSVPSVSDSQILPPSSPGTYVEESTILHHQLPPSSDQNYEILGQSSPEYSPVSSAPSISALSEQRLPRSSYVEESTIIHHQLPPSSDRTLPPSSVGTYSEGSTVLRHELPSSSDQNYEILGQSSPNYSPDYSPASSQIHLYNDANNYEIHGDPSPSPSTSLVHLPAQPQATYSRESLIIPPLQPRAQRSVEGLGYYKKHSRESLRTGSLTSVTSFLAEDFTRAIATGRQLTRAPSLKNIPETGSWISPIALDAVKTHMQPHTYQWSSQLSTVPSASDGGTDRNSRQWSEGTGKRSSGQPSSHMHSRQMASISSSIEEEDGRREDEFMEWPQPSYALALRDATGSTSRLTEDHDENGDVITDMPILHERLSKTRLAGFFNNPYSDGGHSNSMRSRSSSRASSLRVGNTIPTWARLYYGSGERRYLEAPGSSIEGADSRPSSTFRSGSPSMVNFPASIYSPRRRPREVDSRGRISQPSHHSNISNISNISMDITPVITPAVTSETTPVDPPLNGGALIEHSFKHRVRKSSSVWSPHLALDKRLSMRQNDWAAPSVDWSPGGFKSRKNIQIVMFIGGFIMPIAWMIAAFLPLPPKPELPEVTEQDRRRSRLDMHQQMARVWSPMDEKVYQSARRWRIINRIFSVVGVVIIILIIVLVVVTRT